MAGRKYEKDRRKVHKTTLAISVSKQEKDRIIQEAEAMGMSMSSFIRYKLFYKNKEN